MDLRHFAIEKQNMDMTIETYVAITNKLNVREDDEIENYYNYYYISTTKMINIEF